jgi:hypothetical protein
MEVLSPSSPNIPSSHQIDVRLTSPCKLAELTTLPKPKEGSDSYFVFHFEILEIDLLLPYLKPKREELFTETFKGKELISEGYWYKERIFQEKTVYSLKTVTEQNRLLFVEETQDKKEITDKIGSLPTDEIVRFNVTRWICFIDGIELHVDSAQIADEEEYYIICSCRTKDWKAAQETLETLKVRPTTLIYPAFSKIVEYLRHNDPDSFPRELASMIVDTRSFHRQVNPLDRSRCLYSADANEQHTVAWCKQLYPDKPEIQDKLLAIAKGKTPQQLHNMSPQQLLKISEDNKLGRIYGLILYYQIRRCAGRIRYPPDTLKQKDAQVLTRAELELLLEDLEPGDFRNACEEQANLLVDLENEFWEWQANNLPENQIIGAT